MKCRICGHDPHGAWNCNVPQDTEGGGIELCDCSFSSKEEPR